MLGFAHHFLPVPRHPASDRCGRPGHPGARSRGAAQPARPRLAAIPSRRRRRRGGRLRTGPGARQQVARSRSRCAGTARAKVRLRRISEAAIAREPVRPLYLYTESATAAYWEKFAFTVIDGDLRQGHAWLAADQPECSSACISLLDPQQLPHLRDCVAEEYPRGQGRARRLDPNSPASSRRDGRGPCASRHAWHPVATIEPLRVALSRRSRCRSPGPRRATARPARGAASREVGSCLAPGHPDARWPCGAPGDCQ